MKREQQAAILINRSRNVFNMGLAAYVSCRWLAWWMYASAAVILICKTLGLGFIDPVFVLASAVLLPIPIVILLKPQFYSRADVATWLDLKNHGGGRVIHAAKSPYQEPSSLVGTLNDFKLQLPSIKLGSMLLKLALPTAMLVASLLVPWAEPQREVSDAPIVNRARVVESRIEKARQQALLSDVKAMEMQRELSSVVKDASSAPEAAAEALDHLQKSLDAELIKRAQGAKMAIDAAEQLNKNTDENSDDDSSRAKAAAMAANAVSQLKGTPAGQQLKKQLDAMGGEKGLEQMLERVASGNGTEADLKQFKEFSDGLKKAGSSNLSGLQKAGDLMAGGKMKQQLAEMTDQGTGCGGVSRGRGDAPMTFDGEPKDWNAKFKPMPLEPGKMFIPGSVIDSRPIDPKVTPPEEFMPPAPSGIDVAPEEGSFAGERLGPFHQDIAQRYFRGDKE